MGTSSRVQICFFLGLLLAIVGTSKASTIIDGGPCPENWIDASFAGMGCLFFNTTEVIILINGIIIITISIINMGCLFTTTKVTTWEEASVSCYLSNNSTLVEIWTELQLDFLRRQK